MLPDESKMGFPEFGLIFGSSHGFTQREATGGAVVLEVPLSPDGL
jgi:hypothetical protein